MKICFVSNPIVDVLIESEKTKSIGGAELQMAFIGQGLKNKGYEISYATRACGNSEDQIVNGMTVYKTFDSNAGVYGLRYFYPRLYKTWMALKRARSDVYYVRCAGHLAGIVALYCKLNKKKFIFATAHDTDIIPDKIRLKSKRDKLLYCYGLRNADAVVVQSEKQKKLLWENFKRTGIVIRSFHPFNGKCVRQKREFILWVATIRAWKRPLQFIKLAKHFPEEQFLMIGGPAGFPTAAEKLLFKEIEEISQNISNLKFLGFQPFEKTESYFDKAKVFVNTSIYEGFPNTFLQAWRRGIQVISYVDPDNIISQNKLGRVVATEGELSEALHEILCFDHSDEDHIKRYFDENHSEKNIERYCSLLDKILQKS
ncbi:MAG: glycosyltransferase family 4 protein [Candidatus Hodarchaeota archaeon]